jgi:transposase
VREHLVLREREEVPMSIVGGLDIHRRQVTFDYVDTETGRVRGGVLAPADRDQLRRWLAERFGGRDDVAFAVEAGTGWRYVAEELVAAGARVHLAEPADTSAKRGPKRRAKTDRADARLMRDLLLRADLPECWIPPAIVLDCRAILELYRDLREQHEGWIQRIRAVLFHHGCPDLGPAELTTATGRARLEQAATAHLTGTARYQVAAALRMIDHLEAELEPLYRQIRQIARRMRGPRVLREALYGVGPVTALALTCWLGGSGRGFSSRGAVRFTGLDITVHSTDGKRAAGHLSRQGPPVLRWALYEAGKCSSQQRAPDHAYYSEVKERIDGKRAALSQARKIVREAHHLLAALGDDAFGLEQPHPGHHPIAALAIA